MEIFVTNGSKTWTSWGLPPPKFGSRVKVCLYRLNFQIKLAYMYTNKQPNFVGAVKMPLSALGADFRDIIVLRRIDQTRVQYTWLEKAFAVNVEGAKETVDFLAGRLEKAAQPKGLSKVGINWIVNHLCYRNVLTQNDGFRANFLSKPVIVSREVCVKIVIFPVFLMIIIQLVHYVHCYRLPPLNHWKTNMAPDCTSESPIARCERTNRFCTVWTRKNGCHCFRLLVVIINTLLVSHH